MKQKMSAVVPRNVPFYLAHIASSFAMIIEIGYEVCFPFCSPNLFVIGIIASDLFALFVLSRRLDLPYSDMAILRARSYTLVRAAA